MVQVEYPIERESMTNRELAVKDEVFKKLCADAGIAPTSRQVGKFRHKKGLAYLQHLGKTELVKLNLKGIQNKAVKSQF